MIKKSKKRCETCRFWQRTEKGELYNFEGPPWVSDEVDENDPSFVEIGECHRNPPSLSDYLLQLCANTPLHRDKNCSDSPSLRLAGSAFPATWFFDWCGEWQPCPAST